MKSGKKFLSVLLCSSMLLTSVYAQADKDFSLKNGHKVPDWINAEIPPELEDENSPDLEFMYHVYIENVDGGKIYQEFEDGSTKKMGNVIRAGKFASSSSAGFWASHYDAANDGSHSCVTASATNNIHFRVGPNESYDPIKASIVSKENTPGFAPGVIEDAGVWMPKQFTIATEEEYAYAAINNYSGFANNIIYTDILGGNGIFGGSGSMFVGNPLQFLDSDNVWRSMDIYYNGSYDMPIPESLRIVVSKPVPKDGTLLAIEFENWAEGDTVNNKVMDNNGKVLLHYEGKEAKHVADVLQRVKGTGRFGGGEYSHIGTVRASHPGVIDLSTSPKIGKSNWGSYTFYAGGIQIVPSNHAKFLSYNVNQQAFIDGAEYTEGVKSQQPHYAIISSIGSEKEDLYNPSYTPNGEQVTFDPYLEAVSPLFSQYLKPQYIDGKDELNAKFIVSKDFGETWDTPENVMGLTGFDGHASSFPDSPVAGWTNIKILLNFDVVKEEPAKKGSSYIKDSADLIDLNDKDPDEALSEEELELIFPDENLRNVIKMYVTHTTYPNPQSIPSIEENTVTLNKLKAVKYLFAVEEGIADITGIGYLYNLIELNLDGNHITYLPEEITQLTKLDKLILSDNNISEIPAFIENMAVLRWLDISSNNISELPESLCNVTTIDRLNVSQNKLTKLPQNIGNLKKLIRLLAYDNNISELPDSIGSFPVLRELNVFENNLSNIPESIGNLKALMYLRIGNNKLSYLPDTICGLTSLVTLSADRNNITELPDNLWSMPKLTEVNLNNNNLNAIPSGFTSSSQLKELLLRNNHLLSLPKDMKSVSALAVLDVSENSLDADVLDCFSSQIKYLKLYSNNIEAVPIISGLKYMDISDNNIKLIPDNINEMSELLYIGLNNNKIEEIPPELFKITSLTGINLNHNDIAQIPDSVSDLYALQGLYISGNRIKGLDESIGNLKELRFLDISENKITAVPSSLQNHDKLKKADLSANFISKAEFKEDMDVNIDFNFIDGVENQYAIKTKSDEITLITGEEIDLSDYIEYERGTFKELSDILWIDGIENEILKKGVADCSVIGNSRGSVEVTVRIKDSDGENSSAKLHITVKDCETLKDLVAYAETLLEKDYTPESLDRLREEINSAKQVAENCEASQEDLDNAALKLQNCIDALEPFIHVNKVLIDNPALIIVSKGSAVNLTATVYPENATDPTIIWSSRNENIASVDENGEVKANGIGTTVITAASADGNITSTVVIRVTP